MNVNTSEHQTEWAYRFGSYGPMGLKRWGNGLLAHKAWKGEVPGSSHDRWILFNTHL